MRLCHTALARIIHSCPVSARNIKRLHLNRAQPQQSQNLFHARLDVIGGASLQRRESNVPVPRFGGRAAVDLEGNYPGQRDLGVRFGEVDGLRAIDI